jgi:hypothetical protein
MNLKKIYYESIIITIRSINFICNLISSENRISIKWNNQWNWINSGGSLIYNGVNHELKTIQLNGRSNNIRILGN